MVSPPKISVVWSAITHLSCLPSRVGVKPVLGLPCLRPQEYHTGTGALFGLWSVHSNGNPPGLDWAGSEQHGSQGCCSCCPGCCCCGSKCARCLHYCSNYRPDSPGSSRRPLACNKVFRTKRLRARLRWAQTGSTRLSISLVEGPLIRIFSRSNRNLRLVRRVVL